MIRCWCEPLEALWVRAEGRHQRDPAFLGELPVVPVMNGIQRHHGDAAVAVVTVFAVARTGCRVSRAILRFSCSSRRF